MYSVSMICSNTLCLEAALSSQDLKTTITQEVLQELENLWLIVHNQDSGGWRLRSFVHRAGSPFVKSTQSLRHWIWRKRNRIAEVGGHVKSFNRSFNII